MDRQPRHDKKSVKITIKPQTNKTKKAIDLTVKWHHKNLSLIYMQLSLRKTELSIAESLKFSMKKIQVQIGWLSVTMQLN